MYIRQRNDTLKVNDFKYFIVDTDCGGDDSQALIVADYFARTTNKTLLGITCCNGNAFIADVATNVLIVQAVCGSNYPVYLGNDYSMGGQTLKDDFFGKDGLGDIQHQFLTQHKINRQLIQKQKAYKFIAESAIKYKGQISIICLGPLTNLALAYHYNNHIVECFANISMMGTADTLIGLNQYYTAEFNVGLDPEAAYTVFNRFGKIIVCSLETTCLSIDAKITEPLFKSNKTKRSDFVRRVYQLQYSKSLNPLLVDPLAVVVLFKPQLIKSGINLRMNVCVKGHRTRGCTIVDYFSPKSHQHNIYLVSQFNEKELIEQMQRTYE